MMNRPLYVGLKKSPWPWSVFGCMLLLFSLGIACKNQAPKKDTPVEEDPLTAIEDMVNQTKALAKAEAATVDEKTQKALESLRSVQFDAGTAAEKLLLAIRGGKDLMQEVFLFKTLNFASGKADILPAMQAELSQVAKIMVAFPKFEFEISAHTEGIGDPILNLTLSQDRATAIVEALAKLGVDKSRMEASGYGDEIPIADHSMVAGREANQRVELTFDQ